MPARQHNALSDRPSPRQGRYVGTQDAPEIFVIDRQTLERLPELYQMIARILIMQGVWILKDSEEKEEIG